MTTGDDLVKLFEDLGERMAEARTERANLRDAIKDAQRLVPEAVEKEARRLMDVLVEEVRDAMHSKVEEAISELSRDLRARLNL
jgi:F0F1-type ATP synthase membrane subunit b/b'